MKQFRLNTWGSFRCPGIVGSQNSKLSRRGSVLFSGYFWTSQFNIEHVRLMFLFPGICGPHTLKLNQRGLYVFVFLACFGPQPLKLNMRGSFCVNTCLYLKIENRAVVAHFLFCCWGEGGGVIFGLHYWTIDDFGFKKPQAPPPTHHPGSPPPTTLLPHPLPCSQPKECNMRNGINHQFLHETIFLEQALEQSPDLFLRDGGLNVVLRRYLWTHLGTICVFANSTHGFAQFGNCPNSCVRRNIVVRRPFCKIFVWSLRFISLFGLIDIAFH